MIGNAIVQCVSVDDNFEAFFFLNVNWRRLQIVDFFLLFCLLKKNPKSINRQFYQSNDDAKIYITDARLFTSFLTVDKT